MLVTGFLHYLTLLLWAAVSVYVIVGLIDGVPKLGLFKAIRRLFSRVFFLMTLVIIAISVMAQSLVFIEPQEAAIVISLLSPDGYNDRPLRSGLHVIAPVVESVYRYPISWQTYTMSSHPSEGQNVGNDSVVARTQDGQEVLIDCSIIYRVDVEQVIRVHIDWQDRYVADFIRPMVRSTVRNLASQYTVDEINSSNRTNLETDLNNLLREALEDKGFVMDVFLLRNVSFTPEYASAVERKQVAQQDVIESQYKATQIVVRADADADAILIKAQAEADAFALLANILKDSPSLLTYRYIEKLAPNISVMLVPSDAPFILPLPLPATPSLQADLPNMTATPISADAED